MKKELVRMFDRFRERVVSPDDAVQQAIKRSVPAEGARQYIRRNFSVLVTRIQLETYDIYRVSERRAGRRSIKEHLLTVVPAGVSRSVAVDLASKQFDEFNSFFLSLTQSRRKRAGAAFEVVIRTLFRRLGYPFQEQQVIDGRPDFILPSKEHFEEDAMDCIVLAIKRTLRERWRQIVTEGSGKSFYLATIDDKLTATQLDAIKTNKIYLVVPSEMKSKIYDEWASVISFEEFFASHLDPAVKRWKRRGAI